MMHRFAGLFVAAGLISAQSFDAASLRPNKSGMRGSGIRPLEKGRVSAVNATLRNLIEEAYHVEFFQISGGPPWLNSQGFDVEAKVEGNPPPAQLREMLKALLADRFQLTVRTETRDLPLYELVTAKGGVKMPPAANVDCAAEVARGVACGGFRISQRRQITGAHVSIEQLTGVLAPLLGRRVIDKTGLSGLFDIKLEWTPDPGQFAGWGGGGERDAAAAPDSPGPSIFTAVQEQLGLKLESRKGPVPLLVIEHAEQPSAN